jgi:hypothetical protein
MNGEKTKNKRRNKMDNNETIKIYTKSDTNICSIDDFTCITINIEDVFNHITSRIASDVMKNGTRGSELNSMFQGKMYGALIKNGQRTGIDYMKEREQKENKDI